MAIERKKWETQTDSYVGSGASVTSSDSSSAGGDIGGIFKIRRYTRVLLYIHIYITATTFYTTVGNLNTQSVESIVTIGGTKHSRKRGPMDFAGSVVGDASIHSQALSKVWIMLHGVCCVLLFCYTLLDAAAAAAVGGDGAMLGNASNHSQALLRYVRCCMACAACCVLLCCYTLLDAAAAAVVVVCDGAVVGDALLHSQAHHFTHKRITSLASASKVWIILCN
jgi:hypothetical protein